MSNQWAKKMKNFNKNTNLSEKACESIGWMFRSRPLKTRIRNNVVEVTGTLLKPDEWRELREHFNYTSCVINGMATKAINIPAGC